MIPTIEEYNKAKAITDLFENEQNRLAEINFNNFKNELSEYFKNNLIEGIQVVDFELRKQYNHYEIIPTEPPIEEDYEGSNNEDIKVICDKYGIHASFVYWMYHK